MAIYTQIQRKSQVTLGDFKEYARIDHDAYDKALGYILRGVKGQADDYCQNNFTESSGVIPAAVELWILQAAMAIYDRPNFLSTRQDIWEQGANYWEFDWDKYTELLKPHKRYWF